MLVFGESGTPVILFPTSEGRYYEAKDMGIIKVVSDLLDSGKIKIYCPDSYNYQSWLNESISPEDRIKNHVMYEDLILKDVIDYAIHETGFNKVVITGFEMGGYNSINLTFKHPDKIDYLIAISSIINIKYFLGNYYDDNVYFNNPIDYLSNLKDLWYLERIRKIKIVLGIGESDIRLKENKEISEILNKKETLHLLDIRRKMNSKWDLWKQMFTDYLSAI